MQLHLPKQTPHSRQRKGIASARWDSFLNQVEAPHERLTVSWRRLATCHSNAPPYLRINRGAEAGRRTLRAFRLGTPAAVAPRIALISPDVVLASPNGAASQ
jgi:hypothetical protein